MGERIYQLWGRKHRKGQESFARRMLLQRVSDDSTLCERTALNSSLYSGLYALDKNLPKLRVSLLAYREGYMTNLESLVRTRLLSKSISNGFPMRRRMIKSLSRRLWVWGSWRRRCMIRLCRIGCPGVLRRQDRPSVNILLSWISEEFVLRMPNMLTIYG